jgi:hypothetical protein
MNFSIILSRFAFIFVIYAVVTSGYIQEVLSCQMRSFLSNMYYPRHIFGILLVFIFIMMEGGWGWDTEENEQEPNDWSSANVIDTLTMALMIYSIFLLSSKSKLLPNVIFFLLMFIMYCINTQRNYWHARKIISDETNNTLLNVEIGMFTVSMLVLVFGFTEYVFYQRAEYGNAFSWYTFILGSKKCASLKN